MGAQRSGSGWWYRVALESHPRVVGTDQVRELHHFDPFWNGKELHYFDRFWNGNVPSDLIERYHRFFPRPEGTITGEWTPRYMHDHWSMRLLHEAAPEARVLIILRDPIERCRSGLAVQRRRGLGLGKTLDEVAAAVSRSAYAEQLRRVFDFFPREQVLVLQYERCVANPVAEMERTCQFLGLEPPSEPAHELLERRRPPNRKPDLFPGIREDLVARLRHDVEEVVSLCPEIDVSLWPNFCDLPALGAPPPGSIGT